MSDKNIVTRVLDWLLSGYPEDVPQTDRPAVMALLRSELTDEQLEEVVRRLMQAREARGASYVSDSQINEYIRRVVDQVPTASDIDRVAKILGASGLKIAEVHVDPTSERTSKFVKYKTPAEDEIAIAEAAAEAAKGAQ